VIVRRWRRACCCSWRWRTRWRTQWRTQWRREWRWWRWRNESRRLLWSVVYIAVLLTVIFVLQRTLGVSSNSSYSESES